ncbi:MAG: LytTR family DNA-binding domain-containing protein [Bacteroidota bacterium]
MKAILIEDEQSAAANLEFLLKAVEPNIQIMESIETVSDAIAFFRKDQDYDLIFMDIHLADGNSFEIVKEVEPKAPIIFTTAYDQYAIQAFKLNSIDYLLKPIREIELKNALLKFKANRDKSLIAAHQIEALIKTIKVSPKAFRSSFLVQRKDTFFPIAAKEFTYFYIQNGVVKGTTREGMTFSLNEKLEVLESDLDPHLFFRVNRQFLVQRSAVKSLQNYFNGRLIVNVQPTTKEQIIVSKANASRFKVWLNDARL